MAVKELPVVRERGVCCALPDVDADWAAETADLDLTQPTISHHMAKLKDAGLVESEKDGIWVYYRLRRDIPASTRRLLSQLIG